MRRYAVRIGSGSGGYLEAPRLCDAGTGLERSDAQVIASLLVSAVMLGVKVTSLNGIIRTINRKQELKMLVAELNLPRSRGTSIPVELMRRARRATEHGPAETKMVCVLAPEPLAVVRHMHSHPTRRGDRPAFRCGFASRPPSWIIVQAAAAAALRRMSSMSRAQLQSKPKSIAPPDARSGST
jgi:hypothetical protein